MARLDSDKEVARIPVIDLWTSTAPQEILRAAADSGFIFVKHNAIERLQLGVDEMFAFSSKLFSASTETKSSCAMNKTGNGKNHGWVSMGTEALNPKEHAEGDLKEAFNVGEYVNGKPQQPLPEGLVCFESELGRFIDGCHAVCSRILELLAMALKIPHDQGGAHWFSQRHDRGKGPSGSILRLLYYPTLPESAVVDSLKDIRAGAHSDYGSVTLLFRLPDQPGLEIQTNDGEWVPVPVDPEGSGPEGLPILVNIGDLLSFWTGGLLRSTVHRVVFPKPGDSPGGSADRYSIAYFCHPLDDTRLTKIPSPAVAAHCTDGADQTDEGRYSMTARDHLNSRLAETYG